jgi:hypothetical protein
MVVEMIEGATHGRVLWCADGEKDQLCNGIVGRSSDTGQMVLFLMSRRPLAGSDMDENIQLCRRACGSSGRSGDPKLGLELEGYEPSMMYFFVKALNSLMDMSRQLCGVVLLVITQ